MLPKIILHDLEQLHYGQSDVAVNIISNVTIYQTNFRLMFMANLKATASAADLFND